MNNTDTFLSVDEVATLLRVHPRTILRKVADGTIKSVRLGKTIRIPREQFSTHLMIPINNPQFLSVTGLKDPTT